MKNATLLLLATLFYSTLSNAQNKGYIALSFGSSTPVGDFASKDPANNAAGYAKSGAVFDVSFVYKLGKNLGIAALLRGQANTVDAQEMADFIARQYPGVSVSIESKTWSIGGYMVGGYGSYPVSEKLSFETKVLFGFLSATSPQIDYFLVGPGGSGWVRQASASASAFSYLFGAGFKYDVSKRICLLAQFDYLGSKPEFTGVQTTNSTGYYNKSTFSQSFGTINFGIGAGYRL